MAYLVPIPRLARTEAEPLLATIGNTPLLRLEKIAREFPGIEIFAKAEYFNPGIAYAMIGANRGYQVKLVLPANASGERQRILKAYGAEMRFSNAADGSDGAIRLCRQVYLDDPDRYFYPDQYNNPANWKAHFEHTGPEIIRQTGGRLTHFVAAMGTSGTFMGTSRRFKRDLPDVKCISVQPSSGF